MKQLLLFNRLRCPSLSDGFTLIEMMVVVAIVGILAAVAYPSYMNQVRKSRRSDAVAEMSRFQQAQERWRANKTTYASQAEATATASPAVTTPLTEPGLGLSANTAGGYYTLAVSSNTATGYILTAIAILGKSQASDTGCTTLTVNVTNGNASNPTAEANCWSK